MVWQGWLVTCAPLPTSSSLGHWLPFNETGWPGWSKGDTLCGSPASGITPDRDSSCSEGGRERKGQTGEGLPVHRDVLVSHHELEIVNDHVGDVIHVDCMLHGVNHCPEQGDQDQLQQLEEVGMGMLTQAMGRRQRAGKYQVGS